jgi:predicted NAD-dependent protein-ADP-ribosyltransferase YbiA (DUF1768 family)
VKAILKPDMLVLVPETDSKRTDLANWKPLHEGHAFLLYPARGDVVTLREAGLKEAALREPFAVLSKSADPAGQMNHVFLLCQAPGIGLALRDLGPKELACQEPFQVLSTSTDPAAQLISNFTHTPFLLDGRQYESVEGFWQGLKFDDESERLRLAGLHGRDAMKAGRARSYGATVTYEGKFFRVGTWEHWRLMYWACRMKFRQHAAAREALLSTGERPLLHRTRHDSKTIPGVVMADIWMRIRRKLRGAAK